MPNVFKGLLTQWFQPLHAGRAECDGESQTDAACLLWQLPENCVSSYELKSGLVNTDTESRVGCSLYQCANSTQALSVFTIHPPAHKQIETNTMRSFPPSACVESLSDRGQRKEQGTCGGEEAWETGRLSLD